MNEKTKIELTGSLLGVAGFAFLTYVDWRITVGVFLCLYGNNLHQYYRQ
jgi:hypothetical protein